MWRGNRFQANQDPEQSISDEEEIEFHCSERCISLDVPSRRVEPNLALQFDLLSDGVTVKERRKHITAKKSVCSSSEDEVEMPFLNKGGFDCERSKDENDHVGSASAASWSKIHEKLIYDVKQPPNFEGMSFTKGAKIADGRVQYQPNPLHFDPSQQQIVSHSITAQQNLDSQDPPQLDESLLAVEYDSLDEDSLSNKTFVRHEFLKSSMADLLDGLQENKCVSHAIPRKVGKKGRKRTVGLRKTSLLQKTSDDEEPCEIIDNGSSSDDVSKDKSIVIGTTKPKRRTMADQFQEALGDEHALPLVPKQSSNGVFEKLQRVIQREKEHGMDFMQNLRSQTLSDEAGYIDVKLLSRSFEAKLTVCVCSIQCYKKSCVVMEKFEEEIAMHTKMTIMFSSRSCGDVELDAGICVRVYPPWKVVQVVGGNIVILASYFTQILT